MDALLVGDDPFLQSRRDQLVRLAARHAVPTLYYVRDFVVAGGLIATDRTLPTGIDWRASIRGKFQGRETRGSTGPAAD